MTSAASLHPDERSDPTVRSRWVLFALAVGASWVAVVVVHRHAHSSHRLSWSTAIVMWSLMGLAMMAPTAVPVLRTLGEILRRGSSAAWWTFLGGYVAVWLGFAVAATAAQGWLARFELLDGSRLASPWTSALLLAAAGAYQFTDLKQRCLRGCTMPMTFFMAHWRDGPRGGALMGLRHGLHCLGCCWLLMSLAFVGGLDSIWFMVLAAALMGLEKAPLLGQRLTTPIGLALVTAAVAVVLLGPDAGPDHHGASAPERRNDPWTLGLSTAS